MDKSSLNYLTEATSTKTAKDLLHFCTSNIVRKEIDESSEKKLEECLHNFSYTYVVVTETWSKTLNQKLNLEDPN